MCWLGVCLAEALHYAHGQGLVHLDVKPSNVLLTADCQPMLLDFHLARGPIRPGEDEPDWLGGTPGYMSPEQQAALLACRHQQPITESVDARSDVYSLGLLLREALCGEPPSAEGPAASQPLPARPELSAGLRDVLARCLRQDPAARYPSAAGLAEDLRRHLTNRPLVGVGNRSLTERWEKWRRRRPQALLLALLIFFCVGALAGLVVLYARHTAGRHREAEMALDQGRQLASQRRYFEAVRAFDRGLQQLGDGAEPLGADLRRQRQQAARAHDVAALHEQIERSRYLHGDELLAPATLRALEAQCRTAWGQRDRLLARGELALDGDTEEMLRRDLVDVAVLWADCRVRLATAAEAEGARREALRVLDEAESLFGPGPVLSRQRQALTRQGQVAAGPAPRTAWEHYALGRWLLQARDLDGAARSFERAVEIRPQDFWPWFGKGVCAHRRLRHDEAVTAFSVCVALAPDSAACYHNRAVAVAARGETAAALRDCDSALRLDPRLAPAALNRGALRLKQRDLVGAGADFRLALGLGANPAAVHYNQALLHEARQEPAEALACLERALKHDPRHGPSRELRARLQKQLRATPKPM
jgi:tetratricopeptide (TPR) repeat protein